METSYDFLLWVKYFILGLIQGFTEPIPVSSSGHLVLLQHFLGVEIEGLSFEVLVNFASLLAVLVIYRKDLWKLLSGFFLYIRTRNQSVKDDFKFGMYIIVATIPAVAVALFFDDWIAEQFKHIRVIAVTLVITGLALWLIRNLRGWKKDHDINLKEVILVGLAQAVALIPGISRSGATIVAAMALGWRQETALRFSFFLFIPISIGAGILSITDLLNDPQLGQLLLPYTLAFTGSLVSSYYSLKWFMNIMRSGKLIYFAVYCFAVGGFLLWVL
ncbi:undecaprenyl-diphosphatase [Halalkalibacter wakoensis JCM 9140]|uniref:Undecaprenyl-diphosphatase n=1 Tax=Halalkalibacter wakoensis JCM 9140 TaxID=1236970 RepID=W4Q035_9BACI|nr:undecaprenyl-diphosphate phosphatase [Halalkalibacter wakoensis]GAE25406.1 undecaprenyl-diphosphatase [Halalkalibacter wakoensis JCM 9140]